MATWLWRAARRSKRATRTALGLPVVPPHSAPATRLATTEDLYHCFKLFLRREPDEAGWEVWTRQLEDAPVSFADLVQTFQTSEECRRLDPRVVQLDGYKICTRPADATVSAAILNDGEYEPNVIRELAPLLRPGVVFLDVGANLGYQTLMAAARVGPTGRVLAFEPNPDNLALLREGIRLNGFTNITLYPLAAADRERTIEMHPDGTNSTSLVSDPSAGGPAPARTTFRFSALGRCHTLKAVALDAVLADLDRVDVVKLDIDGGEPRALQGMDGLIRKHRPAAFVEYCPECIKHVSRVPPEVVLDYFYERDYDLYDLDRTSGKSARPLAKDEVLAAYAKCGITHLDLVAYPKRG